MIKTFLQTHTQSVIRFHLRLAISIFALLTLSQCASFYAKQSDVADQIDQWVEENQYEKALETIAELSPKHKDHLVLNAITAEIEQAKLQYIQTILKQAADYELTQDWVSARQLIDQALSNLPKAPELKSQFNYYESKRIDRLNKDKAAILIAESKYIITSRPHQESALYNANNRFFAQQSFSAFLQDAKRVSRELYALGQAYWQNGKHVQAREALTLSMQTSPNTLSANLLGSLMEERRIERETERKQQLKIAADQWPELEKSFIERLNYDDLDAAKKILAEMTELNFKPVEEYGIQLRQKIIQKVIRLMESGNTLYSSGYINEAVKNWQLALNLDPGNPTLIQQLKRAETFLDNIDRWQ